MREIIWLDSAVNDLVRLREFIAVHNPNAAQRAAELIKETLQLLKNHPELGKVVEALPDYRDLIIPFGASGYVIRYRLYEDNLYIVCLKHAREVGFKNS